ncbi:MAG: aminotransferase class V-fold PLP-dependent enzyme [Rickettsiales bacterium]|jgi:cysteine desulfurase/selenocysteine lyase|nr:aminotransferase class V-fold PLP-dependent enzyme [Rickettsiales bacterium]
MAIYLDAAASALKPDAVLAAEYEFAKNNYANSGRGVCPRAVAADEMVDNSRAAVAGFIGARPENIVWTGGTTGGINMIADILARTALEPDSVVIVSDLDHHSARLPWQDLADRGLCKIWICPLDKNLNLDADALRARVAAGGVAAVVLTAMSNVIGAAQDIKKLVAAAGSAITIIDAAQYVAHCPVNASDLGCDFLAFSMHKIGGGTGLGVLYIKNPDRWEPVRFGGGMYLASGPARFEAGTLPLVQIAGVAAAIKERGANGKVPIKSLHDGLSEISRIKFISPRQSHLTTFVVDGMNAYDFGVLMGARGICLRAGNMCASWLHQYLGVPATVRMSPGPWNTDQDIDETLHAVREILR